MEYSRYVICVYFSLAQILEVVNGRLPEITITDVTSLSPKKISLQWTPTFVPKKGQIEYVIRYKMKRGTYLRAYSKKTEAVIKDLLPDTTYIMAVRMVNSNTRGDWSDTVEIKTKSKSIQSDDEIFSNITVDEVTETSVILNWTLSKDIEEIEDFADFQIILKSKEYQQKLKTKLFALDIQDLNPDTSYAANLYIIRDNGKKIRTGRAKFQTLELQRKPPRKLKAKFVTEKVIAVKWKHIKPSSDNESVSGYILEYKNKGSEPEDACSVNLMNTKKSFKIQGLLPNVRYSIRVAGIYNDVTGPFTEWLRVKTLEATEGNDDVLVYHTSPTSVLLLWKQFPGINNITNIEVTVSSTHEQSLYVEENVLVDRKEYVVNTDERVIAVNDLIPETRYNVTLEFKGMDNCKYYIMKNFVTIEAKCVEGCVIQPVNESYNYNSYLRMIPLSNQTYLVTWQYYKQHMDQLAYKYVVRVLGEPFLNQLSAKLLPFGNRYSLLSRLNKTKTYTINLQVFSSSYGGRPLASQYLLVMPIAEVWHSDMKEITNMDSTVILPWPATSSDIITILKERNETVFNEGNEFYDAQNIPEINITLFSKLNLEESWGENTSHTATVPKIHAMEDVKIREEESLVITCFVHGDPYPMTSLLNISSNQTLGEDEIDVNQTMFIDEPKYVGSTSVVDGRAFTGVRKFISINNVTIWDSGLYACVSENIAGSDVTTFKITVLPKPPGKVIGLYAIPLTPFEIAVNWKAPDDKRFGELGHVIGFHVSVLDEFHVVLREKNVSDTVMKILNMDPSTTYGIKVAAFHEFSKGESSLIHVRTPDIPKLGPPQRLIMKTLNSTTIQVSWLPPKEVIERRIHLRAFLFHYREVGSEHIEEMQLDRMFTNVSIIGLTPDRKYEAQVLAMSEDAQISLTYWIHGNTSRESYMNESIAPPPPNNVYLNLQNGNIIVSWLPPFPDENILVRGYIIDVFYNNTKLQSMQVDHKESSVIIYGVEMGILYRISVRANNRAGESIDRWEELQIPVEYVTKEPVKNFKGVALSSTQLELTWDPPESGVFSRFVLSYTLAGDLKPELPGGGNLPASSRSYIVRSLRPFTGYFFQITPYLKDIRGVTSNTTVMTLTDKPKAPPTNISLTVVNATTIRIRCSPPETGKNGPIIQYRIAYRERDFRDNILTDADDDEELDFYLNGLEQATVYEIRVRALTVNGSGPWSAWLQEKTAKRVPVLPKVPQNLTASVTDNTVTLTWLPPDQHISEITGFVVGMGRFIPEVYRDSVTKDKTSYVFDGLDPETVYIVSVRSFNDFGESAAVFELVTTE